MKRIKIKTSNRPQRISKNIWYYEDQRSIEIYVDYEENPWLINFRLPIKKLKKYKPIL